MLERDSQSDSHFIYPVWPAPIGVKALCTTRLGGVSLPPFDGFNLATHVGDDLNAVLANRQQLVNRAGLSSQPVWLNQQHTTELVCLDDFSAEDNPLIADASWTQEPGRVAVVLTADCLPILITNLAGTLVCAIHAGWKGLASGIVRQSVEALPESPERLMAWIGPAIGAQSFEVGEEVRAVFVATSELNLGFFKPLSADSHLHKKYLADLPGLVKYELNQLGVSMVYGGDLCTYRDESQFFSYRRSGQTGRIASLIWLER